jgi:putative spermidine/putrescine transport system ATP-binding protein
MYKGKIEQVGTPFEIYNFPHTAFVANFVGHLNTASVEVIDPERTCSQMDGVELQAAEGWKACKR